jgi:L-threonylcarbamoyladenylate synthase
LVPKEVTGGLETVAVRSPRHPIAKALIQQSGLPLAAPSANLSGRPSPTTADHVLEDLEGRVEIILDGGKSSFGLESTVLDALSEPPMILRPGSITLAMLREFLPTVQMYKQGGGLEERPPTPGLKYRHYSPNAAVALFYNHGKLEGYVESWLAEGKRIVRLTNQISSSCDDRYVTIQMSATNDSSEIAHNLFEGLRSADSLHPDYIVCESVPEDDEGLAIMNRLAKAASISIY